MSCGNNVKQLSLALQNYHDVHLPFPPARTSRSISTHAHLLPFMERTTCTN